MRWPWIAVAALAGGALFAFLFPRYESGASDWKLQTGREQARLIAQQLAREEGLDISSWRMSITASVNTQLLELRRRRDSPLVASFTPLQLRLLALAPDGTGKVEVGLFSDGRLARYDTSGLAPAAGGGSNEATVQRAFLRLAGGAAGEYESVSTGTGGSGSTIATWERRSESVRGFLSRIKVEAAKGRLVSASIEPELAPGLQRILVGRRREGAVLLSSGFTVVAFLSITAAAWIFFSRLGRRRGHARLAGGLALWFAGLFALTMAGGNLTDELLVQAARANLPFTTMLLNSIFGVSMLVLLWMVVHGAGFAVLPAGQRPQWLGTWLLAKGQVRNRRVGKEVLAGLLLGLPLACIPFLIPASGLFREISTQVVEPSRLLSRAPWAVSLGNLTSSFDALGLVAFLLPAAAWFLKPRWLNTLAVALVAIPFTAAWRDHYYSDAAPAFVQAVLLVAAYILIARAAGLLGLAAAMVSSYALPQGALFLMQPAPELSRQGLETFLRIGAGALAAAALARFGRPEQDAAILEALDPAREDQIRTDQERLAGELAVARRAQEGMLPDHPPAVPGYELDALCRPALEVGGDLYDFHTLPDGRLLFCVADVSGKGVTAALFMTLTKGLLAALSRHLTDAEEIVTEMNRHLFAEARRRTFVTLALGVLDPRTGSVDIVRAGHNPPLLHRARTGETRFLQPKGLGMGLVSSGTFRPNLAMQTLKLEHDDLLIFYSDGLPETMDPFKQQFTEERLRRVVASAHDAAPAEMRDKILAAVDQFRSDADPHDDLTLLILRAQAS